MCSRKCEFKGIRDSVLLSFIFYKHSKRKSALFQSYARDSTTDIDAMWTYGALAIQCENK